jgi:hypothetical protein
MNPKNRQVISSATKRAHREPRPIHTPKTSTVKNREGPPTAQGTWGEGGNTQSQSTLILIDGIFKGKKTAASPIGYHCSALNVHNTALD